MRETMSCGGIVCGMLRSKNFLILLLFFVAASIAVWLVTIPTPDIRSIMAKTHQHIATGLNNMDVETGGDVRAPVEQPVEQHDPIEVHKVLVVFKIVLLLSILVRNPCVHGLNSY